MWAVIGTALVPLLKWIFSAIAKRKLNDKEFLEHIEAHQAKRVGAGKTATDFEDAMAEAEAELDNPSVDKSGTSK